MIKTFKQWLCDTAIRTIKTFAQALLGALGTGGLKLADIDWRGALSIAILAAIICVLTCISTFPNPFELTDETVETVEAAEEIPNVEQI